MAGDSKEEGDIKEPPCKLASIEINKAAEQKNKYPLEAALALVKDEQATLVKEFQERESCLITYNGKLYYRLKDVSTNQEYFIRLGKTLNNPNDPLIRIVIEI